MKRLQKSKPQRGFKHLPPNKQHTDRKKEDKQKHKEEE